MKLIAEYVSPGHPDRLADQIVEEIVDYCVIRDKDALCGIECAVNRNTVFIDGRIACGSSSLITLDTIKGIVKDVYEETGYRKFSGYTFHPTKDELKINYDLCIDKLSDEEREIRKYSDDQNIVTGYANDLNFAYNLPIEQFLVLEIGKRIYNNKSILFGPDFKVLIQIDYTNGKYSWDRITVSLEHTKKTTFSEMYSWIRDIINYYLFSLNDYFQGLRYIDPDKIYLNGAGDFIVGGPMGDNGLSGKKLVVDFYGPRVPIGGGAISGKDPHKVDYCGALRARQFALILVKEYKFKEVFTRLAWSPGEESPYLIEAYEKDPLGIYRLIDSKLYPSRDWFSIECINQDLGLDSINKHKRLLDGYMYIDNN